MHRLDKSLAMLSHFMIENGLPMLNSWNAGKVLLQKLLINQIQVILHDLISDNSEMFFYG